MLAESMLDDNLESSANVLTDDAKPYGDNNYDAVQCWQKNLWEFQIQSRGDEHVSMGQYNIIEL